MRSLAVIVVCLLLPGLASGEPVDENARVSLPLAVYDRMVDSAREVTPPERPAPARYALGQAEVHVRVEREGGAESGQVRVRLPLRVLQDGWTAVPLLANGTAVAGASVDQKSVELVSTADGLAFVTSEAGNYTVELEYEVDATGSERGRSLAIPVPLAPGLRLEAELPGSQLDATLIPAAAVRTQSTDTMTTLSATVPSTRGVQLSWRLPQAGGPVLSRARYRGELDRDAVRFDAELSVELLHDESVLLPLLPKDVTLSALSVDGKPSPIALADDRFAARVRGAGLHRVQLAFEVQVERDDGPPRVVLRIPEVPVSELELSLPGDKEISLQPAAHVSARKRGTATVSHAFLPLTSELEISWAEAVPEAAKEELLANANIYHLVHAEEGVLYVRAMVVHQVTSGRTNVLELDVPDGVQVSDIRAEGGGIKQAVKQRDAVRGAPARYSVFLDRELEGELTFDVFYERKLGGAAPAPDALAIPLIKAAGVSRQRGMIALLASKELTLKPDPASESGVTRVGENQLPVFVRKAVDKTIAHTYKYLESDPQLLVRPAPPERKQGKFDAQVDTLISLSDVTLKASATVEVSVKSGSLETLGLRLPAGVNFLGLTAPSLRTHSLKESAPSAPALVEVQFTQQMDGQFRVELSYEKIISEHEAEIGVPTLHVDGAEVEQGKIAIEALSAVEVGEARRTHLSPLDPSELPQQLVLKTTNPILRAYKYVQVDPGAALALRVTRHKEVDVQKAAIDDAVYRTLYTRDGLSVTTASFQVRNSREQFLKLKLPRGAKVWSAFVAGRPEKPAIEAEPGAAPTVLIKVINSTEGFPVELIYEVPSERVGALGRIRGELPRPDMVVTRTRWDVYLPHGIRYGDPESNLERIAAGEAVGPEAMQAALRAEGGGAGASEALRIEVPSAGVRYSFSKLYANRSADSAAFSVPYSSEGGAWLARLLAVIATVVFWIGLWLATRPEQRRLGLGLLAFGLLLGLLALGSLGAGVAWPLLTSLALLAALGLRFVFANRPRRATADVG